MRLYALRLQNIGKHHPEQWAIDEHQTQPYAVDKRLLYRGMYVVGDVEEEDVGRHVRGNKAEQDADASVYYQTVHSAHAPCRRYTGVGGNLECILTVYTTDRIYNMRR